MELFTPSSAAEDDILRKKFEKSEDIPTMLHVGVTSMGTEDVWYTINSGKILDYDFEWSQYTDYYSENANCLRLRKRYEKFSYEAVSCVNAVSHFVCQKVVDVDSK